ncbi:MAG: hypothetical protein WCW67_03580 [Candidatus Margulisiibacteriota bacterium]|jgi:hypothetical protein
MTETIRSAHTAPIAKPVPKAPKNAVTIQPASEQKIYSALEQEQAEFDYGMCMLDKKQQEEDPYHEGPDMVCVDPSPAKSPTKARVAESPKPRVPNATAKPSGQPEPLVGAGPAVYQRGPAQLSDQPKVHPCQDGQGVDLSRAGLICDIIVE